MKKLIELDAAIDEIKAVYEWHDTVTVDRLIQHFKALPTVGAVPVVHGRWIPITERYPDIEELVIVYDAAEDYMSTAMYRGHDWMLCGGYFVDADSFTHWMPLPEPPKEATNV